MSEDQGNRMPSVEEQSLLRGRLNFFLTATAFLIVAFAVVVTFIKRDNGEEVSHVLYLAHAINATGLYSALFFAMNDYMSAMIIEAAQGKQKEPSSALELAKGLIRSLVRVSYKPLPIKDRPGYVPGHIDTWLVPSFFTLFWIVVWFIVIPDHPSNVCEIWVPIAFGIGLPLLYIPLVNLLVRFEPRARYLFRFVFSPLRKWKS